MGELHVMEFRFDTFYLLTFFETGIGWVQQLFENHVQHLIHDVEVMARIMDATNKERIRSMASKW